MSYNITAQEIEQELKDYRARHVLRHQGMTYTELKAHRARRWRAIKQALYVLGGIALAVLLWVGR